MWIWSHLLKKSLVENLIFCAVLEATACGLHLCLGVSSLQLFFKDLPKFSEHKTPFFKEQFIGLSYFKKTFV